MDWLVADFESFLFGAACGAFIVLVAGWFVISWFHDQVNALRLYDERLRSETD